VKEKKKVGERAEKTQNISDIFTNPSDICTNSIEIFENINDILTLFCASAEFPMQHSRVSCTDAIT
jgi:hypothetical protein